MSPATRIALVAGAAMARPDASGRRVTPGDATAAVLERGSGRGAGANGETAVLA